MSHPGPEGSPIDVGATEAGKNTLKGATYVIGFVTILWALAFSKITAGHGEEMAQWEAGGHGGGHGHGH